MVGGRWVIAGGVHARGPALAERFAAAMADLASPNEASLA